VKRIEFNERLNESQKRLNERWRINKSWKKKLKKIKTFSSRILKKESKINSFYDEISSKFEDELSNEKNIVEIHLIATASFNILSRKKNVKIFVVFIKNLKIQFKKQSSNHNHWF
jgi:cysteinyl-tRNA synthetase